MLDGEKYDYYSFMEMSIFLIIFIINLHFPNAWIVFFFSRCWKMFKQRTKCKERHCYQKSYSLWVIVIFSTICNVRFFNWEFIELMRYYFPQILAYFFINEHFAILYDDAFVIHLVCTHCHNWINLRPTRPFLFCNTVYHVNLKMNCYHSIARGLLFPYIPK